MKSCLLAAAAPVPVHFVPSHASVLQRLVCCTPCLPQKEGLKVSDVVVLIDREQGGRARLASQGLQLHAAFTLRCGARPPGGWGAASAHWCCQRGPCSAHGARWARCHSLPSHSTASPFLFSAPFDTLQLHPRHAAAPRPGDRRRCRQGGARRPAQGVCWCWQVGTNAGVHSCMHPPSCFRSHHRCHCCCSAAAPLPTASCRRSSSSLLRTRRTSRAPSLLLHPPPSPSGAHAAPALLRWSICSAHVHVVPARRLHAPPHTHGIEKAVGACAPRGAVAPR